MLFSHAVSITPSHIRVPRSSFQKARIHFNLHVCLWFSSFILSPLNIFSFLDSRASASQVIRRRTHICDRLLTLGQYQFIPRGVPQNPFYTWSIPKSSGVLNGILLSLHGEVVKTEVNPALDHRLTVDQTFLLRQRTEEDDTDDDDGTDVYVYLLSVFGCSYRHADCPIFFVARLADLGKQT